MPQGAVPKAMQVTWSLVRPSTRRSSGWPACGAGVSAVNAVDTAAEAAPAAKTAAGARWMNPLRDIVDGLSSCIWGSSQLQCVDCLPEGVGKHGWDVPKIRTLRNVSESELSHLQQT